VTYDANKSAKKNKKNKKKNRSINVADEKNLKEVPKEGRTIKKGGKVDPQSNFKDNLKKVRYR
jgi:hypothetical protein